MINNVKFKVSMDISEVKEASKAMGGLQGNVSDLTKEYVKVGNEAQKSTEEFVKGSNKAAAATGAVKGEIKNLVRDLNVMGVNVGSAFDTFDTGAVKAVRGLGLVKVALIAIPLVAFLAAIVAVVSYFTKTEKGAESLERFFAALSSTISVVVGRFARLGEGLVELSKGNFAAGIDKIKNSFTGIAEELELARNSALEFTTSLQQIEDAENNLALSVVKTRNQIQLLIIKSKDVGISEKERIAILKEADKLEQGIISQQIALQTLKVKALQKENDLKIKNLEIDKGNKTDALRQAEIELENLIGNSIELRGKLQNRTSLLEVAGTKKKVSEKITLERSLLDEINRNTDKELKLNLDTNAEILNSTQEKNDLIAQSYKELYDGVTDDQAKALNSQLQDYDRFQKPKDELEAKSQLGREERRKKFAKAAFSEGVQLTNDLFKFASEKRDVELSDIQNKQQQELKFAGDNKQQQQIINNKYAAQERAIKIKQAQADKDQALFNIAINTAVSVSKVAYNPALIALAIGMGLVQAAFVVARPLPKFFQGTKSLQGGSGGIDDINILANRGEAIIPTATNQMYKPAIDAIFDKKVPAELINNYAINYGKLDRQMVFNNVNHSPELLKEIKGLRNDVKNKKEAYINIDKNGIESYIKEGVTQTIIANNYFKP